MKKLLTPKILLGLICILFLSTRLYKIADIPPSVYWDEASIGYNAYSIVQTDKDEWGEVFPIHFRAFGEFKLPVYIYLTAFSVKMFGLNEFAIRFPAVVFSLGIVVLTYLLAKKLTDSEIASLLSSFFISISRWFFIFSRTGYEVTAGLFFYLLGIYLVIGLSKKSWSFLLSVISFILSIYSYNSFRIIAPLTILVLLIYSRRSIPNPLKKEILPLTISIFLILLSIIPIFRLYKYDSGAVRLQTVSTKNSNFITNYLSHFSPDFLLFQGDKNLRSQQQGFGQMTLPEYFLLVLGLVYVISRKPKNGALVLSLILLGPIPAAITKEAPHALRSLSLVPFLTIISGWGVMQLLAWVKASKKILGIVITTSLIFFANYFLNFLSVYPIQAGNDWQLPYKQIFTDKNKFDKYSRILISDQFAQPYIFALFYLKYDPGKFRQEVIRNSPADWGFSTVNKFGKFEFGKYQNLATFLK